MTDAMTHLRWDLRLLAEEGSLPKWQVVDILLDFEDKAIAHYVLWKVHPVLNTKRVYLTWDEVDAAVSELETP